MAGRVAGVVSLNGRLPQAEPGRPLFALPTVRRLRVLIGHGIANSVIPFSSAERDRKLLYTAGADVRLISYPATHKLHADMLRDVNRWVIGHVNAAHDALVLQER
jgi:phospholipase/carboxylesterase